VVEGSEAVGPAGNGARRQSDAARTTLFPADARPSTTHVAPVPESTAGVTAPQLVDAPPPPSPTTATGRRRRRGIPTGPRWLVERFLRRSPRRRVPTTVLATIQQVISAVIVVLLLTIGLVAGVAQLLIDGGGFVATDDRMAPLVQEGDIVLVGRPPTTLRPDLVVVVGQGSAASVVRVADPSIPPGGILASELIDGRILVTRDRTGETQGIGVREITATFDRVVRSIGLPMRWWDAVTLPGGTVVQIVVAVLLLRGFRDALIRLRAHRTGDHERLAFRPAPHWGA
jgi:hypothetical protein